MAYEDYELGYPLEAAQTPALSERAAFIRRVYAHLAGAILLFIGIEAVLVNTLSLNNVVTLMGGDSPWGALAVMAVFILGGFVFRYWARAESPPAIQYLGLVLYVALMAVMICPILFIATHMMGPQGVGLIAQAGILTLCLFAGLTISVFITRRDYSGLAPILSVGSMIAFGVIICAIVFGFTLGLVFSFAIIALMAGYILYDTSNVIHHYRTDQHVSAALELFADIAVMFFHILRILMILASNRN
jgi:FtsH-binding integral membrane protein